MKIGNLNGRLVVVSGDRAIDVETASEGLYSSDPQAVYDRWASFVEWAGEIGEDGVPFDESELGAPVPRPRQVFAIGLNYREHAKESNFDLPEDPVVFTKFPSSITGPRSTVELPTGTVDWEIELVAVIGAPAHHVAVEDAWDHVAGLTVGQDLSERVVQRRGPAPQFSLGKSFPGFAPIGPFVVTPDEFEDRDAIPLTSTLETDGKVEVLQDGTTADLIFSVPELISRLSAVVTLFPGDILFTGTPSGVGIGSTPPRYLAPGQTLTSTIPGIGSLVNPLVGRSSS
ncbi:fumarylacetoacetate hydrolase family protein [Sphaerisporangium sp. NPDC051011]|uniref:fumarylacetoacetate hydrolase family protein n=1 Tax=Sphaerisporangium sp. NPDC051011 TaxID=3155792 RepID=UPI0033D71238